MRNQRSKNSTKANDSSLVDRKQFGVTTYTFETKAKKIKWLEDDKIWHFRKWSKGKKAFLSALGRLPVSFENSHIAELTFSYKYLKVDKDNICALGEINYFALKDLLKFIFELNTEMRVIYNFYDIVEINLGNGNVFNWNYYYAHQCYAEGKITEADLIYMLNINTENTEV